MSEETPPTTADSRREAHPLRRSLVTIQAVLFLLPALVLTYLLYSSRTALSPSQLVVLASTLLLVLAGLVTVRQVFDRIAALASVVRDAASSASQVKAVHGDTAELLEITRSFNGLVGRLEELSELLDRKVVELSAIRGLIEFSSRTLSVDYLLGLLLDEAMAVSTALTGSVLDFETEGNRFRVVATRGLDPGPKKDDVIAVAECLSSLVLADRNPVIVDDILTDPRTHRPNRPAYASPSFIALPVMVRGDLVAVVNLAAKANGEPFTDGDRDVLSLLISQVSLAIESARLHTQVQEHLADLERSTTQLSDANTMLRQEIEGHRQAQIELKDTNALLRNILDSSTSISIVSTDLEGNVLFWNRGAANLFGYQADEVVGRQKISILYPDEETRAEAEQLRTTVLRDKRVAAGVIRERTQDGRTLWVQITISPRLDDSGAIVGLLGIGEDVTQRRELEEQLLHAKKLEAIGTLAGGVAHDFNNLLMAIQGHTSLMLFGLDPTHPNYHRLRTIEEHVRRAADLTRQLLGFARGGHFELRPTDLREIIAKSAEVFARTHKSIEVEQVLDPHTPTVEVDRGQIEQVLLNLYLNAAQAMPEGGRLTLRCGPVELDEGYARPLGLTAGSYLKLSATDSGVGIDKEIQDKIFEPFFTTKRPGKGSGLGLASAYGIVKKHRGIITVASERGKGAMFTILLPASTAPPVTETAIPADAIRGSGMVLVVDDEENVLQVSRDLLASLGYQVVTAGSGVEAVARYREHVDGIRLVVLDLVMPGMGGRETFERLREINPEVKVLLSSGFSLDGQASEVLARGCRGFIQKPFSLAELSARIHSILE